MGPRYSWSILSVLIVLSVLWKPAYSDARCNAGCKGSSSSPTFLNGHKYNYGVEGTVSVYLTGADKQETSVKLLGQVSVASLGNCAYVLRVQNLVISGPDGKKYNKPPGLEKLVRFTLEDGRVGSDICAEEGDTRRSLNIKRAIISLLQTEQKASSQVDVFGACPTEASSSQEGGAVLVHRSRDLSRCAHREQGQSGPVIGITNENAQLTDTQILQSTLSVESKVLNGVPEKVSATEEYLYRPFSVGENGARSKVHTKLTLTGKSAGAEAAVFTQVRTIIFENPHGVSLDHSNFQSALNAVKETAKTCGSEASSKSAGNFAQLVRILKPTNKDDLIKVFNAVKGNSLEKRVFLDGLLRTGSGNSIEASIQILKQKELDALEQQIVFLSLGNAKHVNNEALKAATSLLDIPNIPKDTYLGVGALAGAYCRDHFCHTRKSDGIVALSTKLGAKLQNCRPKTKLEEDNVVAVLKGIRNIRHLEDVLIDKLVHCAVDNNVKARVRAAALEAFQADPCSAKIKKTALDLLKNRQLDSEIRIKAYLAVIECPCGKSATEIKNLLETEPVHQVGRYITSSLRHIRASTNPDKRHAREHYGQIRTPLRFNVDDRKYSFYREASYNVDALGVGGSIEQSVIYSQNNFLPRSVSLNLTTEVFGHSFNVFEIGGRQGNLDRVVEHFLGPRSFLRTEEPQSIIDDLKKRFKEAEQKVEHGVRGRRSIKTEVDNFDKHVKDDSTPYNNELDLDIYVKLFGTDAVFLSLGDDKGFNFNRILDQLVQSVSEGVNKIKHFQKEIHANVLFLDTELVYPTSTGLPLKLDLIGSATARLDIATNIDIRQILRSPENAKVDIKLVPSTDIEVSGLFLVDADVVATGIKVVTNLHSSTGGHLIAKILENGKGIDVQFALPIEKQEIVTASNDLVYYTAEKGQPEKNIPIKIDADRKEYAGCFDQLSKVIGLTLCGEVSVPFSVSGPEAQASLSKFVARYPLTGPSKIKLVLEKNDLRGYHVKGIVRNDNPERRSFELLFEVEGSQNRRTQLSGELINTQQEKTFKLNLESPIKTAAAQVSLYTKPSEYVLFLKGNLDAQEYYARAGFNVQGNDRRSVFKPIVEYQLPGEQGKQNLKVDGQLIRESSGHTSKYTLEGIKINLPGANEVVDLSGHYVQSHSPNSFELDLKAKKGEHNLILGGSLKGPEYKFEFQNTVNPYVNFKINGHSEWGDTVRNDIELYYGGDLRDKRNCVTFNQLLKHYNKPQEFSLITKNKFEVHALPIKIKFDAEVDPKKVDIEIEGQYIDKKAEFDLEARTQIKQPGDYSVKLVANADKSGVEVFAKRDIVSADKSNLENYIAIKDFGRYELSGVVTHKSKPNDVHLGAVGHLKINGAGKKEDIKFDIGVVDNANQYNSHAKISYSKGDILDWLLKITRGANSKGELKLIIKDTISANGQFGVTDADGKGNGAILIDFKNAQRKIKGDVKFQIKNPVYNADVEVFLDFEKNNKDKVSFSTKTKTTDKLVDSKNKLEYAGQKTEVNVNVNHDQQLEAAGKSAALIEVVLPTERLLSLKVDRDITLRNDVYNGHAELVLSDAVKRGGPASKISYKSKLNNCNFEKDVYHYEGQLELSLKDGKNLQNTFFVKNSLDGGNGKFELKSDVNGNLIAHPASLSGSIDYTNPDSLEGTEKYRLKGSYGSDIGFEVVGSGELKVTGDGDKKYVEDSTVSLRLPFEKAHDIKIVSNWLWLVPENKNVYLEYTSVQSVQVNADTYKFDASGKVGPNNGFTKVKVLVPHVDPVSVDFNYKTDLEGERKTGNFDVKALYGKGKSANVVVEASSSQQEYAVKIKTNTPQAQQVKKLEFSVVSKNPTPDSYNSIIIVDADGRVYKTESVVVYSKSHPVFDVKYTSPSNPKTSRIYLKGEYVSSNQGKSEIKIENIKDISLDIASEASIQKENVAIKAVANSEALGWKNYNVQIISKDAGSGKRLEFHATNDNKNVLSGSTSFISKQEGPKTIVEGSGSVKVKEEQKSANFKYIRTLLTEGNEQGVETFLNLAIGERSYVAESRITNLEYKNSYVYCEEKKQCANAELHSKINVQKPGVFQHQFNVGVDLRKLGFAPEFGLQVSSEVSERKLPQYNLDLHINKEDKKYHLHVYSTPDQGKFPAGVTLSLPSRVLAVESHISYSSDSSVPFSLQGHIDLHPDKNKPQLKVGVRYLIDVQGNGKSYTANSELGFSHPKLGREAVLKARAGLNSPAENTYKFESSASISHPTLGKDRETKILLEVSPQLLKLLVDTPIVKVIDLEGSSTLKENLQQADLKFSLLEGKPVLVHAIAKDFQYYEFTTGYSDRKLSVVAHLEPEKRVDVSADIVLPGERKNIIHGALYLQDNLVKSDYGISKENFNYFVNALKNDLTNLEARIKELGEKASNDFKNTIKRIEPTAQEISKSWSEEFDKLSKEIANDKALKETYAFLSDIFQIFAKAITEIVDSTKPLVEQSWETINATIKKIGELYTQKLEPQLKKFYETVAALVKEYMDGLIDLVAHFAALVTDVFEKHKAELQELTNAFAEIFKDLTRLIVAQLKEFRVKVGQIFADVTEQIKELPFVNVIKEKWQELAVPDQVIGLLNNIHQAFQDIIPTREAKAFVEAVHNYVTKKLKQEKCDDAKELRNIYEKFAVALTSLVQFVRAQINELGVPGIANINPTAAFFSGPGRFSAPSFGGAASFSLLNQFLKGDVPDALGLLRAYRPRSLNPLDEVPAKLRAVIVNGQHIFTFDGRHLTFPGTCRYVLAHDYVDRNFTLILQLQNGNPKALILENKDGKTIELKENGQVILNGQAHGFPVVEKDAFAFRQANGRIGVGSEYGVLALCTNKLQVCYFEVSGFYLGKLRGLLGDGNNEPYDDFRLPNGKISNSESEFGNAYKLAGSCPPTKTPEHSAHQHHAALPAACEAVFGGASPLRPLSLVLDISPFRQACIHAVTGDSANAVQQACDLARGYAALALTGMLPAVMPAACVQCTDTDKPKSLGESYELKLPKKQADIIVTFETTKPTEEGYRKLAVPLVSQLVDTLKSKHIDDIKVYLVGITPKMPYPILYDTDLKLRNAKVQFDDESRISKKHVVQTGCDRLDYLLSFYDEVEKFKRVFGLTNVVAGYHSVLELPLRPGAVKHAINVVGETCSPQFFLLEYLRGQVFNDIFEENAYTHTLISVAEGLTIGGGKNPAQVVGWTKDYVLLVGDKKQTRESEQLRESLSSRPDSCVSFTEATDGLVLSSSNFLANPAQQKQFLQTASAAISNKILSQTLVQDCTCGYVDPFRVRSICVNKSRKEAARRRK